MLAESAAVAAHYDRFDRWYRDGWGFHVHHGHWERGDETVGEAVERLVGLAVDPLELSAGKRVADAGCGYGATARWIADHCGAEVDGFTVSAAQVREGAGRFAGRGVRLHVRDWLDNGIVSGTMDAVVSIECLSHVADKARFFEEVGRVLRPGGRASILCLTGASGVPGVVGRAIGGPIVRWAGFAAIATLPECRALAAAAGLAWRGSDDFRDRVWSTWPRFVARVAGRWLVDPAARAATGEAGLGRALAAGGAALGIGVALATGWLRYHRVILEKPGRAGPGEPISGGEPAPDGEDRHSG